MKQNLTNQPKSRLVDINFTVLKNMFPTQIYVSIKYNVYSNKKNNVRLKRPLLKNYLFSKIIKLADIDFEQSQQEMCIS